MSKPAIGTSPPPRVSYLWGYSAPATAFRLFLTCWLVYSLHFATNIVRETYLAMALGDHLSFRVDEYANLHDDLFEIPNSGWYINSNPGVSMLGAIPYGLARPVIDRIVAEVRDRRALAGAREPPSYKAQKQVDRQFFEEAWRRGLDIKFALAAFVMQVFCMAPASAFGVVAVFLLLWRLFGSVREGAWLALLYAFGTPVFFRTGFLNQNLMIAHVAFLGFLVLWNPGHLHSWSRRSSFIVAGAAGGATVLLDYSGVIALAALFLYGLARESGGGKTAEMWRYGLWFGLGALGPLAILWFYQWQSFGHPFYPAQHWMAPVAWIDEGYRGFDWPSLGLFASLGFDYRYGLFTSCPLLLLALASPWTDQRRDRRLPVRELTFALFFSLGFWLFFSCVNFTRWQFNTGVRYLAPVFPFLFVVASTVLTRLPRPVAGLIAALSVLQAWAMSMYREVGGGQVQLAEEARGHGVLDPVLRVITGGLQLPALATLGRIDGPHSAYLTHVVARLLPFLLMAAVLAMIWRPKRRRLTTSSSDVR